MTKQSIRFTFLALLLIGMPVSAQACIIGPETATKEQMEQIPPTYSGFQAKITSSDLSKDTLPHDPFLAKAAVLEKFSADIPDEVTLIFGPCSLVPKPDETYYFLTKRGKVAGFYEVQDQPSMIVRNAP